MNVAGLTNLGFQAPAAKPAGGKAPQGKEKSSFESALGQTEDKNKQGTDVHKQGAEVQKQGAEGHDKAAQTPGEAPNYKVPTAKNADAQAQSTPQEPATDVAALASAESLPAGPPSPTMNGNGLGSGDRVIGSPVNPALVTSMGAAAPQVLTQDDGANSLTRRVVWNDFLRKMSDLGVSAEDVLHAFGSLSDKDLKLPPEQTVDKVVMALGLDGQQAAMAKQYFQDLIAKTKSKSFGDELNSSNKMVSLSLMTERDQQKKYLQKTIEDMDRNFFINSPYIRQGQGRQAAFPGLEQQQIETPFKPLGLPMNQEEEDVLPFERAEGREEMLPALGALRSSLSAAPTAEAVNGMAVNAAGTPMPQPAAMNGLIARLRAEANTPEDKKAVEQLVRTIVARQQLRGLATPQAAMMAGPVVNSRSDLSEAATPNAPPASMPPAAVAALNGIFGGEGKHREASQDSDADSGNNEMAGMNSALAQDGRVNNHENLKSEFQSQLGKASGQPQTMAVPDLVQQAHVMVRDGGGEMKVTLHPEGLGEVAMRVSVNDGKVAVQMITESDEAKKLIERQIGDLKSTLTQNHLTVDSIKVDTASNLGRQLDQQYQDAQRQQAHSALEQFRQDQQGWRRSFFETGSVNPYHSQVEAPRDGTAPMAAQSRHATPRRLDLVA